MTVTSPLKKGFKQMLAEANAVTKPYRFRTRCGLSAICRRFLSMFARRKKSPQAWRPERYMRRAAFLNSWRIRIADA